MGFEKPKKKRHQAEKCQKIGVFCSKNRCVFVKKQQKSVFLVVFLNKKPAKMCVFGLKKYKEKKTLLVCELLVMFFKKMDLTKAPFKF